MADKLLQFYSYPQDVALHKFLPILCPSLPYSNPLYIRLQAPHNEPSRHCLFAASFPPTSDPPEFYTILFADRSRHEETQSWIFHPLITEASLSDSQKEVLTSHMESAIYFLKNISIPEAPGWPFSPIIKFGCLHEYIARTILDISEPREAVPRITNWNVWLVPTTRTPSNPLEKRLLPEAYTFAQVPYDQIDIVISTSSIVRQPSTYARLPSVGVLDEGGNLVAWGYVGIDGSFATLYVLPEHRGQGLAKFVATELMQRLDKGAFKDMGFDGKSGWVHADVYSGNKESESVMRYLGGKVWWKSSYIWVDSDKF